MAEKPKPKRLPPTFAEILEESSRLKRQSAEILKRMTELDEKIARAIPGAPPAPRKKK